MTTLTTSGEILFKLGKNGQVIAGKYFNELYNKAGYPTGKCFSAIVGQAVNMAFRELKIVEFSVDATTLKGNVADAIAHKIDSK